MAENKSRTWSLCVPALPLLLLLQLGRLPTVALGAHEGSPAHRRRLEKIQNITRLLDGLLGGYDKKLRPGLLSKEPTSVNISISVMSMGPVSEIDETFALDCYFRQVWRDGRLAFAGGGQFKTLSLGTSMLDKIWKPDTYIWNGKESFVHDLTIPNRLVRLNADGKVLYSQRLTISASCPMRLKNFPMDVQKCVLQIGSFGYRSNDIFYDWTGVVVVTADMAQFIKKTHVTNKEFVSFRDGEYSKLEVTFVLERQLGYYVMNFFCPSSMVIFLSWLPFWLPREATADRLGLGVTTVLTMTFIGAESRQDLPKISYPTALDVYVLICFALLFLAIMECTLVHMTTKYGTGDPETQYVEDQRVEELRKMGMLPHEIKKQIRAMRKLTKYYSSNGDYHYGEETDASLWARVRKTSAATYRRWANKGRKADPADVSVNSVSAIDRLSRPGFPLLYLTLIFVYWQLYFRHNYDKD